MYVINGFFFPVFKNSFESGSKLGNSRHRLWQAGAYLYIYLCHILNFPKADPETRFGDNSWCRWSQMHGEGNAEMTQGRLKASKIAAAIWGGWGSAPSGPLSTHFRMAPPRDHWTTPTPPGQRLTLGNFPPIPWAEPAHFGSQRGPSGRGRTQEALSARAVCSCPPGHAAWGTARARHNLHFWRALCLLK